MRINVNDLPQTAASQPAQARSRVQSAQAKSFQAAAQTAQAKQPRQAPEMATGSILNRFDTPTAGPQGAPEGVGGVDVQFSERTGVGYATKG